MHAVQAANSGHPDTPMAMAPVAYCPWLPNDDDEMPAQRPAVDLSNQRVVRACTVSGWPATNAFNLAGSGLPVMGSAFDAISSRKRPRGYELAGLREPASLEMLSTEERNECVALWKEIGAVLKRGNKTK